MGAYIYALRSPKTARKVQLDSGEIVEAGSMSYAFKPFYAPAYDSYAIKIMNRWNAMLARLEKLWNGIERPTHVAITDGKSHKIKVGDSVITWPGNVAPFHVYDDPDYGRSIEAGKVARIL